MSLASQRRELPIRRGGGNASFFTHRSIERSLTPSRLATSEGVSVVLGPVSAIFVSSVVVRDRTRYWLLAP